eukprot:GHVU01119896.1.p1 GENE.GHVU01119896.1~~GHVU01119896.1.p1  ORF type:complete len:164 (-),score=12.86 GHVU01119896.1:20-511(-)
MLLHGGRFLNGVCLFIRCYHNTADPAMKITIVSVNPPLKESVDLIEPFTQTELTGENRESWLAHVKAKAEEVLLQRQKPGLADELAVYVRCNKRMWHSLDHFKAIDYKVFPQLIQGSKQPDIDPPEFLLTDPNVSRKHTGGCCCSHRLLFGCRLDPGEGHGKR